MVAAPARRVVKTAAGRATAPRKTTKSSSAKPRTGGPALICPSAGTCSTRRTTACARKPKSTPRMSCSGGGCASSSAAACSRRPSTAASTRPRKTTASGTSVRVPTTRTTASTKTTTTTKTAPKKPAKKALVYRSRTAAAQKDKPKHKTTAKKSTTV